MKLTEIVAQDKELGAFLINTQKNKKSLLTGINERNLPLILLELLKQNNVLIIIEENENKAQRLVDNLAPILPEEKVQYFAVDSTLATQRATASPDELAQRIKALHLLLSGDSGIVVTTAQGLEYQLNPKDSYIRGNKLIKSWARI